MRLVYRFCISAAVCGCARMTAFPSSRRPSGKPSLLPDFRCLHSDEHFLCGSKSLLARNREGQRLSAELVAVRVQEGDDRFLGGKVLPSRTHKLILTADLLRRETNDRLMFSKRAGLASFRNGRRGFR